MPNAFGQITTIDVRKIRDLHSQDVPQRQIAELVGVSDFTVRRYVGRNEMYGRAQRYAAFVERAASFVPLLVSPSPF